MPNVRFLQIHSLHGYSAVLLNRDDSGLAKRMTYGDTIRTRISSQCLKRHWRVSDDIYALSGIDGATAATRSREIVTRRVIDPLKEAGHDEEIIKVIGEEFQLAVYGDKGGTRQGRQPLLLGEPEIEYLAHEAQKIADIHGTDPEAAEEAAKAWRKDINANMRTLRENCSLPGGLVAAMFGRMVTSDVEANIDAAVHVAHAFTVHEEESESDYFTVVDDLHRIEDDAGADHIGESELTSGLFYGYVVVDREMLLRNLGGDSEMAGEVTRRLVHLIATVTPGAKLGSTAPYDYASWLLIEAGEHQPRSLSEAFRKPCKALVEEAEASVNAHIEKFDAAYGTNEARRSMSLTGTPISGAELLPISDLAAWAGSAIQEGVA